MKVNLHPEHYVKYPYDIIKRIAVEFHCGHTLYLPSLGLIQPLSKWGTLNKGLKSSYVEDFCWTPKSHELHSLNNFSHVRLILSANFPLVHVFMF